MQKDGIHQGYIYDELFDAIIEKRSEITRCKYCDNDYYSQFLYYDKRVCDALQDRPWENEEFADCNKSLPKLQNIYSEQKYNIIKIHLHEIHGK